MRYHQDVLACGEQGTHLTVEKLSYASKQFCKAFATLGGKIVLRLVKKGFHKGVAVCALALEGAKAHLLQAVVDQKGNGAAGEQ